MLYVFCINLAKNAPLGGESILGVLFWSIFMVLMRLSTTNHKKALTIGGVVGFQIFLTRKVKSKLWKELKL